MACRRSGTERDAAAGAGVKRGQEVVGAAGGAVTRLRSKVGQGAGLAGGKRTEGLSMGVGGEEKRSRRWEPGRWRCCAAAGAKRGCVTAGGAAEVDKQVRRWALQGRGQWVGSAQV